MLFRRMLTEKLLQSFGNHMSSVSNQQFGNHLVYLFFGHGIKCRIDPDCAVLPMIPPGGDITTAIYK